MLAARNNSAANGYTAKATTNTDTPPYTISAQMTTMPSIAWRRPAARLIAAASERANPEISISLPNNAPSMKTGK